MLVALYHRALAILPHVVLAAYGSPLQLAPYHRESTRDVLATLSKRLDEAATEFATQFRSPAEILAVLLIIGGDIVQKAIAQLSGGWITPISFSFGWVSYSFSSLLSAFGDGVFLPQPDLSAKIITVGSGGAKINESWIIARLIRDLELEAENEYIKEPWRLQTSLMVSVYDALPHVDYDWQVEKDGTLPPKDIRRDWVWYSYFLVCALQLGIAAVPLYDSPEHPRNWSILLITGSGILLALWTGSSWQFRKEKFACRRNSSQDYLLTRGNGHKHVFLIRHRKAHNHRYPRGQEKPYLGVSLNLEDLANVGTRPAGWKSRAITILNAVLWIFYLVTVGGQTFDTWYLFAVGSIGMSHNIMTASIKRDPDAHGFHMKRTQPTCKQNSVFGQPPHNNAPRPKVMDGLRQLEDAYPGAGIALLSEFFPGGLRKEEEVEWGNQRGTLKDRREAMEQEQRENKAKPMVQATPPPVVSPTVPPATTPPAPPPTTTPPPAPPPTALPTPPAAAPPPATAPPAIPPAATPSPVVSPAVPPAPAPQVVLPLDVALPLISLGIIVQNSLGAPQQALPHDLPRPPVQPPIQPLTQLQDQTLDVLLVPDLD